jgi:hypothetical protein
MAYASIAGRARTSSRNPRAFAVCDRCGFLYNHVNLRWQFDWAGASLINKRILVCDPCYDTPQNQLRAIILPADPTPIMNPRTEQFSEAETNTVVVSAGAQTDPTTGIPIYPTVSLITQNGNNSTTQPIGNPVGLTQNAVMPLFGTTAYGVKLTPLSVSSQTGTSTITVTFSSTHGLATNDQIAVQGLSNNLADGTYSITVTTATAFTYQVNSAIPAGGLLQSTTLMVTALVGLPYDYDQIPLTGA